MIVRKLSTYTSDGHNILKNPEYDNQCVYPLWEYGDIIFYRFNAGTYNVHLGTWNRMKYIDQRYRLFSDIRKLWEDRHRDGSIDMEFPVFLAKITGSAYCDQ
jgi:hypothetical protein